MPGGENTLCCLPFGCGGCYDHVTQDESWTKNRKHSPDAAKISSAELFIGKHPDSQFCKTRPLLIYRLLWVGFCKVFLFVQFTVAFWMSWNVCVCVCVCLRLHVCVHVHVCACLCLCVYTESTIFSLELVSSDPLGNSESRSQLFWSILWPLLVISSHLSN